MPFQQLLEPIAIDRDFIPAAECRFVSVNSMLGDEAPTSPAVSSATVSKRSLKWPSSIVRFAQHLERLEVRARLGSAVERIL
jgi:hypothetical protein